MRFKRSIFNQSTHTCSARPSDRRRILAVVRRSIGCRLPLSTVGLKYLLWLGTTSVGALGWVVADGVLQGAWAAEPSDSLHPSIASAAPAPSSELPFFTTTEKAETEKSDSAIALTVLALPSDEENITEEQTEPLESVHLSRAEDVALSSEADPAIAAETESTPTEEAATEPLLALEPTDPDSSAPDLATESNDAPPEPATDEATASPEAAIAPDSAEVAQPADSLESGSEISRQASDLIGVPLINAQAAYVLLDDESSARLRLSGVYAFNPNVLIGATVDLTTGDVFSDSREEGLNINELYVTVSPEPLPELRFTAGLLDLTSYFDRNSFAKDAVTHFFDPVFQTNPALAATGISTRPALLANWSVTDNLEVKAAVFSSSRDLDELDLDAVAAEIGLRFGNGIIRGTFASDRDAGRDDGFNEIFQFNRGNNEFGLQSGDREDAFGINAEYFIPELGLGLFGRYGWYENRALDRGGDTFSFGFNLLDLFMPDDRLGLAYGRQLSNDELRRDRGDEIPDVLELFYDLRLSPLVRAGVAVQQRNGFSETVVGFRIRADVNLTGPNGILR